MKIVEYKLIRDTTLSDLERTIRYLIAKESWQPIGTIQIVSNGQDAVFPKEYFVTLVKYAEEETQETEFIELSSGHVFAKGSVKSISPWYISEEIGIGPKFNIYGIGYTVQISSWQIPPGGVATAKARQDLYRKFYDEAKFKLLGVPMPSQ